MTNRLMLGRNFLCQQLIPIQSFWCSLPLKYLAGAVARDRLSAHGTPKTFSCAHSSDGHRQRLLSLEESCRALAVRSDAPLSTRLRCSLCRFFPRQPLPPATGRRAALLVTALTAECVGGG